MVLVSFWRHPDPNPYRLKRIRPNDTDPKHCMRLYPPAVAPMATLTADLQWPQANSCQRPSVPLYLLHSARLHRRRHDPDDKSPSL